MYRHFINCTADKDQIASFIATFQDGEIIGIASFEFHNDEEYRIYIEREDNNSVMISFKVGK